MRRCLVLLALTLGCNDDRVVAGQHVLTEPTQMCREGAAAGPCRGADTIEALLQRDDLEIVAASETSTGVQGAHVLTLRGGGIVFRAKWRPDASKTTRNDPRLELGAYAVQKLFLEPSEYVVPPTAAHCFPVAMYRKHVDAKASGRCVSGVLSYWLEDVASVADARKEGWFHGQDDHALDVALFGRNPDYRDSIARVNMLTYIIGHRDSHARNFVFTQNGGSPGVYSVDNSLSFTMAPNPRIRSEQDWSKVRVPALPRAVIGRLGDAIQRASTLKILTAPEIAGVQARMRELITATESGAVATY